MTKVVAVCGATGKQGGATVAALQKLGGFKIIALTRNPASVAAQCLAAPNVEVVKADFDDPASLRQAFSGCDAVFGVTDFWVACQMDADREVRQGKNLVDAAKAGGVKHFVWSTLEDTRAILGGKRPPLDSAGHTVPHFDGKAEIGEYLKEQMPGAWSFVFTSVFYENVLPGAGMDPQKQEDGSYLIALPVKSKMAWQATADIGNTAAALIAGGPEEWAGKSVGVNAGLLGVTDVAEAFSKVFGKKVVGVTPEPDAWVAMVVGFGGSETMAKDLGQMFYYYDAADMCAFRPLADTEKLVPHALSLEAWLQQNKDKFAQHFA